jgi:error-prone DNA polymerase
MNGRYVIQWNKDDINILGLMKIDVLSLGMLTAVRRALELLRDKKNIDWNLAQIPHEDPGTYDMIRKADTVGVFQIESRAQMSLLPRLKPRTWYDIVISVAIVRPGPIQGGMVHPFLRRRAGLERVTYAHPALEPILKKTLGIPLFQEQVMQIAVTAAGFTPGEADELRRIMSSAWKKQKIMDGLRQRVISGMLSNGLKQEYAEQIYRTIEGFSSYGFPESHSASFALITYASCYLKHHHPDAFVCALLNSQPMGFYSPRQLIADAQRHGVRFLALDVQRSDWDYTMEPAKGGELPPHLKHLQLAQLTQSLPAPTVEPTRLERAPMSRAAQLHAPLPPSRTSSPPQPRSPMQPRPQLPHPNIAPPPKPPDFAVRAGFRSVHGLKEEHIRVLCEERAAHGPFKNLPDLVRRARLPRAALIRLASAGALASFGISAREALWIIQGLCFDPQSLLFGEAISENEFELEAIPREGDWEAVQREYLTKGYSIETHPLAVLRPWLKEQGRYNRAAELAALRHRAKVRVAGLMSLLQKPPTAKGMCFISLEDETGILNVIITPDLYQKYRLVLLHSPLLDIEGTLESRDGVRNVRAELVRPLLKSEESPRDTLTDIQGSLDLREE